MGPRFPSVRKGASQSSSRIGLPLKPRRRVPTDKPKDTTVKYNLPTFLSHHVSPGDRIPKARLDKYVFASFWRGGTSKGVFIPQGQLPNNLYPPKLLHRDQRYSIRWEEHPEKLQLFLQGILGSPDPFSRQLNGLGK